MWYFSTVCLFPIRFWTGFIWFYGSVCTVFICLYIYLKGFAPCRRPPSRQATGWLVDWLTGWLVDWLTGWLVNWLTGWLLKWVTFYTNNCHFGDVEAPFSVPGTPFWWSWGPGGHPMDTLKPRCQFLLILGWFRGSSWNLLWRPFCDFLWFGIPKWETVSRSMFLVIQGRKRWLTAVALCARTTVKPVVFEWFHFFTYSLI